ncbi:MAG TPA: phosphatase PAP2 family protein [Longimicrobium sp.]|jgi:membrane-associated phospholipid phosphatase
MRLLCLALVIAAAAPRPSHAQLPRRAEPVVAGALLAGAALLDRSVDGAVPQGGGTRLDWATRGLNYGGRPAYALVALGGAYAGGRLADAPELSSAAAHALAALLASGVANGTLKFVVGRERPSATDDPHSFHPFNTDNRWQAFPSGHAVVAFSLATSISHEAGRPWATALAFGGATLVGWSRIYDDKHWTSDVVGGALTGYAVSRATLLFIHRRRPHPDGATVVLLPNALLVTFPR